MTLLKLRAVGLLLFLPICHNASAQDTLYFEGFEDSSYQNLNYSTPPCTVSPDIWDTISQIDTIHSPGSNFFWGIRDLNGNCGNNTFESIATHNIDLSNFNYTTFSFDYFYYQLDNGDDLKYVLTFDSIPLGEVWLINGSNNSSSYGWLKETIYIPDSVNNFTISILVKQNGDNDYLGIDNLTLTGSHKDSCFISTPILTALNCNDNGSSTNALDDFIEFNLYATGQNLGISYSLYQNDSLILNNLPYSSLNLTSSFTGSIFQKNHYTIIDNSQNTCYCKFEIDSTSHCSTNYQLTLTPLEIKNLEVNCHQGDSLLVHFISHGTYHSSNQFKITLYDSLQNNYSHQLFNFYGNYIDTQLYIYLPYAISSGSNYILMASSSFPEFNSNTLNLTIQNSANCTQPHLTGILLNACSTGINEGSGELIFGYTGSYSLNFCDNNFEMYYAASLPFSSSHLKIDSFVDVSSNTLLLNSAAGCTNLFVDAYEQNVPSQSHFLICRDDVDINSLYWHNLCGTGPIYVLYAKAPNWSDNGLFSNSTSTGIRYIRSIFSDTLNHEFKHDIYYDRNLNSGIDGDFTTFSANGGEASSYQNLGCDLVPGILASPLALLTLEEHENFIQIDCSIENEIDFENFYLQKHVAYKWNTIQHFQPNTNTMSYSHQDTEMNSVNTYRLLGVKESGQIEILSAESLLIHKTEQKIIARTNMLGQSIKPSTPGWQIIRYQDQSSALIFQP